MVESGEHKGHFADKFSNSLLVDSDRIPYMHMGYGQRPRWSGCDKLLFWVIPLFIFLAISGLLIVVTEQEKFIRYETLTQPAGKQPLQWNELIFTQLWGFSSCLQFKDKHPSRDVTCRYEHDPSFWSIHGIWPTRQGSEGPNFCSKVQFNITQLNPIRTSLDQYWYEIDNTKQGDYFWSHEWVKHGSCAKQLSTFGTELKYFAAALALRDRYNLYTIFQNSEITPEKQDGTSGYDVDKIADAIKTALGSTAVPYIQCLRKKNELTNSDEYYLLAVELCFSKDLKFVSCSHKRLPQATLGDNALPCPQNVPIKYIDSSL